MKRRTKKVSVCANPNCKWPIYQGDHVWRVGRDLCCHIECVMELLKVVGRYEGRQTAHSSPKTGDKVGGFKSL